MKDLEGPLEEGGTLFKCVSLSWKMGANSSVAPNHRLLICLVEVIVMLVLTTK